MDGHVSHLTLPLSEFCKEKDIILISFLPHATHILQPMDVAFFAPLKEAWKTAISKWRMNNCGNKLSRAEFAPLLEKVLSSECRNSKTIFQNGLVIRKVGMLSAHTKHKIGLRDKLRLPKDKLFFLEEKIIEFLLIVNLI